MHKSSEINSIHWYVFTAYQLFSIYLKPENVLDCIFGDNNGLRIKVLLINS